MAKKKLKLKRGMKYTMPILSYGEPAYVSDEKAIYVGTETGENILVAKDFSKDINDNKDSIN